jgi:Domain of unknown function (DUF6484)
MKISNRFEERVVVPHAEAAGSDQELALLARATRISSVDSFGGVVVGELVAIQDEGCTPLVLYPGQAGSAAIAARSVVDLQGPDVGKRVALTFEGSDPQKPIVIGVLRMGDGWPLENAVGQVEFQADGARLVVSARDQLVLRCGNASITLTKAGKVLIEGTYVSARSSGVNRIKGGSVQIN